MWTLTVSIFVATLILYLLWRKRKFLVLKELGIPGPEPSLLFGNLWELSKRTPLVCHKEWVEKYGKVVGYYFGTKPVVIVTDVELLKIIQVSEFHKFINRPAIISPSKPKKSNDSKKQKKSDIFSNQLSRMRDKKWKDTRSILTPSFTTSKMKQMSPIINTAIDTLIENIEEKAENDEIFDIYKFYQGLTMDVIGRTAFGVQTNAQKDPNDPFIRTTRILLSGDMSSIFSVLSLSFPEFGFLWSIVYKVVMTFKNKGKNPLTELVDAIKDVIKLRRENKTNRRPDLLQLMIDAEISESDLTKVTNKDLTAGDEETENKEDNLNENGMTANSPTKTLQRMTDEEILDNSILFFLAGYETTSTALAFTTHFLLHYPEVQEKVRKEVKNAVPEEDELDYASVQKLQYLDQVLTESLRLYPPIYLFVNREVGEDVQFGHIRLKKGLALQVPVYIVQHDPELWPDPEKFQPERFSPENKPKNNAFAFQAFGGGPRNCIGMRFAQMEAKLALARILLKYKLVPCDQTDKDPINLRITAGTLTPSKGIYLKAVPC